MKQRGRKKLHHLESWSKQWQSTVTSNSQRNQRPRVRPNSSGGGNWPVGVHVRVIVAWSLETEPRAPPQHREIVTWSVSGAQTGGNGIPNSICGCGEVLGPPLCLPRLTLKQNQVELGCTIFPPCQPIKMEPTRPPQTSGLKIPFARGSPLLDVSELRPLSNCLPRVCILTLKRRR